MRKPLLFSAGILLAVAAQAKLGIYPEYPKAIERDKEYFVRVFQDKETSKIPVYNHCEKSALTGRTRGGDVNRRFCEFSFDGTGVRVDIAVRRDVETYKIFPARLGLKHKFNDGVISVWLDKPCYFGLQLNDYDKTILSIFADKIETDAPKKGTEGVMFVEGWVDGPAPTGVIETDNSIKEIYIAPGAVLNARLKIRGKGTYLHGRGMILDPMSDIFRYDQILVSARGLVSVSAEDCRIDGVKLIDARTFNFCAWAKNLHYSNVKVMASMMCSDGITSGGPGLVVDNAWLYVGDNALVVSGVQDAIYRNVVIGTSCKAIFPQGTNRGVKMENIDVFRADEGIIANEYNGVLKRNNKWSEMGTGLQKKEPGPQDLEHQGEEFYFDSLSSVDATHVGYVFRGRNMGTLPKSFVFKNLSVNGVPGNDQWRNQHKKDGVSVAVNNNPEKWLISSNYVFAVTNLYLDGKRAYEFPEYAVRPNDESGILDFEVVTDGKIPCTVPLKADVTKVDWKCPENRLVKKIVPPVNLLKDREATRSIWQRCPSWLLKFDATMRGEDGEVLYRVRQCERNAGIQAILTERVKAAGFGKYRLSFDAMAKSSSDFSFKIKALSNEASRQYEIKNVDRSGAWKHYVQLVEMPFDAEICDLVALNILVSEPTDEIVFKNFSLVRCETVSMLEGELWWGIANYFSRQMPFDKNTKLSIDLRKNNFSNQCASFLFSNKGRVVWCENQAKFSFDKGNITIEANSPIILEKGGENMTEAYKYACAKYFPPSGKTPPDLFFTAPQLNTWIELTYHQNQKDILAYAKSMLDNGVPAGVLMIDDTWQAGYGDWRFEPTRFENPKAMMDELHGLGYKVMLWMCPYVGGDLPSFRRIAWGRNPDDVKGWPTKGGFLLDRKMGQPAPLDWWNGYSCFLDFTHPNANAWFTETLDSLVNDYGADGFKLDGADLTAYDLEKCSAYDKDAVNGTLNNGYIQYAMKYPYSEIRNTWRMQQLPVVVRLHDKSHSWDSLLRIVADMIGAGLLGQPFICPDMVGGGEWTTFIPGSPFEEELFVRSGQIHALCPMMQISASPWRYLSKENQAIFREIVALRQRFVPMILKIAKASAVTGEPILRSMEYNFPGQGYERIIDQFMMGDEMVVAPQLEKGALQREVVIPPGKWLSDNGEVITGPKKISVYTPLSRLPYFVKQ